MRQASVGWKHSGSPARSSSRRSQEVTIRNWSRFQEAAAISLRKIWAVPPPNSRSRSRVPKAQARTFGSPDCASAALLHPASGWKSVLAPVTGTVRFAGDTVGSPYPLVPGTAASRVRDEAPHEREIDGRAVLVDAGDRRSGQRRPEHAAVLRDVVAVVEGRRPGIRLIVEHERLHPPATGQDDRLATHLAGTGGAPGEADRARLRAELAVGGRPARVRTEDPWPGLQERARLAVEQVDAAAGGEALCLVAEGLSRVERMGDDASSAAVAAGAVEGTAAEQRPLLVAEDLVEREHVIARVRAGGVDLERRVSRKRTELSRDDAVARVVVQISHGREPARRALRVLGEGGEEALRRGVVLAREQGAQHLAQREEGSRRGERLRAAEHRHQARFRSDPRKEADRRQADPAEQTLVGRVVFERVLRRGAGQIVEDRRAEAARVRDRMKWIRVVAEQGRIVRRIPSVLVDAARGAARLQAVRIDARPEASLHRLDLRRIGQGDRKEASGWKPRTRRACDRCPPPRDPRAPGLGIHVAFVRDRRRGEWEVHALCEAGDARRLDEVPVVRRGSQRQLADSAGGLDVRQRKGAAHLEGAADLDLGRAVGKEVGREKRNQAAEVPAESRGVDPAADGVRLYVGEEEGRTAPGL